MQVTKAYTPPQPSTQGLPDTGSLYHYGTFPALDYSLIGSTRPPMIWEQQHSRDSARIKQTKIKNVRTTQEEIVRKAMKPAISAPGAIAAVARRSARDLESALAVFSPNNNRKPVKIPKRSISVGGAGVKPPTFSSKKSVGGPRTTDNIPSDRLVNTLTRADTIIMNARRKQSILLDLVIKLQSRIRMFVPRRRYKRIRRVIVLLQRKSRETPIVNDEPGFLRRSIRRTILMQCTIRMYLAKVRAERQLRAVLTVQRISRGHLARLELETARKSAIVLQRLAKTRRSRFIFLQVRRLVSKVQSLVRGFIVRKRLAFIYKQRMSVYRDQIFYLWDRAYVSLSLRTKLWPTYRDGWGFSRLRLAEAEVMRLRKLLGNKLSPQNVTYVDETIRQSDSIGIDSTVYRFCKTTLSTFRKQNSPDKVVTAPFQKAIPVVKAERLQVYERLDAAPNANGVGAIYNKFDIPAGEKLKKVCLANTICKLSY
jgi:hypothetical protein